jgi:OmcA/MtrC family decaheme c-type cytochrome
MALTPRRVLLIALLTLFVLPVVAADRKRASTPTTPTQQSFSVNQLEYYLSDDGIAYIRPGLKIKVNSVTIGSDRKPVVDLTLTDNFDQPLDRLGKTTPGAISISCILAWYNPATRQYVSYTTRSATSPATSPKPNVTVTQAGTDSGGAWTDWEAGHTAYVFKTALPAGFDQTKTTTLAIYATRNLTEQIGKNYYANLEYDFRPDGQKVTESWDKINQAASCNNCHNPLSAHGGSRQDVKLCVTCHQPQTSDPDTANTVDMKVMVHKIHFGPNLPSVKAGTPYQIIGNANSMHDFSAVTYPQEARNCQNCHEGTNAAAKPAQAMAYLTNPSAEACGSCHDDVNFKTGANHPGGVQADNSACASCHVPDSGKEFDASVKGAHVVPTKSKQLRGLKASIVSVSDMAPGKKPTAVFKFTNGDGTAVDGTKLGTFSPILAGPTASYGKPYFRGTDGATKGVFDAANGTTTYTFATALPADASGTWTVSADIRRTVAIKRADGKADISVTEGTVNPVKYVAITGTMTPRRVSVTMAQCNTCHDDLAMHGGQRKNIDECVICHNPMESDVARRPANAGQPESVSMQRMIHRIHSGEELTQDYTVYGFGGSQNTFNEVRFPGDRRDCVKCHTANGYKLPLQTGIASVDTPRDYFAKQGPGTAACLGCHDSKDAAAHAYLNTTTFGGTNPAEACATCHGTGKDWDVAKMHAR